LYYGCLVAATVRIAIYKTSPSLSLKERKKECHPELACPPPPAAPPKLPARLWRVGSNNPDEIGIKKKKRKNLKELFIISNGASGGLNPIARIVRIRH